FGGHTAFDQGALVSDRGAVQITFGRRPVLDNLDDDETEIPGRTGQEQHGAVATSASTSPAAPPVAVVVPIALPAEPAPSATGSRAPAAAPATSPAGRGAAPEPSAASSASAAASAPRRQADAEPASPGRPEAPSAATQAADRAEQEKREFAAAAQQIKDAVKNDPELAGLADHLAVDVTPEGLRIQLLDTRNQAMFAFGSAVPNEAASLLLAKITPILMQLPEMVSIGGHTDAAPYPGPNMTNWELSTNRANAARRLLLAAGLPEQRLRDVTGHADHDLLLPADPLAPANRRIAIVVLRGTGEPGQGAPEARASGP
ncbi:MAG TPA: OmpA family protein, partial [Acetobacteraceae bacterium]|nr:OmpA family protein [Acetobacteraceae bacterium]